MENQDLDLIGQTVGNMPYKVGITDKDGKVTSQFVVNASTNRIDIPESSLGTGGVPTIPSSINLFIGSADGNILLWGPSANYDNVQDGLLLTLGKQTLEVSGSFGGAFNTPSYINKLRLDLSSIGLNPIKIPKDKLVVNNSFDISDQLSQYIGKSVKPQGYAGDWGYVSSTYSFSIVSFEGASIKVLPNATLNMSLIVHIKENSTNTIVNYGFPIPVIQVNDYKN